jgi:hypothetical protein
MADRYCPYCGEMVPSTSLTCPKCYKKIPTVEPEKRSSGGDGGSSKRTGSGTGSGGGKSDGVALILAIIPGLFGLLGLGMLYKNYKSRGGLIFLILGIVVFIVAALILTSSIPILNILFAIPFGIIYGLLFLGNIFLTVATRS